MNIVAVTIDCSRIVDKASFHAVFAEAFGFPSSYGNNMDAWIDCMSSLDDPDAGMTSISVPPDGAILVKLDKAGGMKARVTRQFDDVVECAALVNWRRVQMGARPLLFLAFDDKDI